MIRTQVSLDEQAYRDAKAEARREGISLAALLRRALATALHMRPRAHTGRWMDYAGTLSSGDPDASVTVDDVVYGRPRP
jgi:hypothetical protein